MGKQVERRLGSALVTGPACSKRRQARNLAACVDFKAFVA